MAKDTEKEVTSVEVEKVGQVYVLAYKQGRRLFHTEYYDKQAVIGRIMMLLARNTEFRVEFRDMSEEEKAYYETL